MPMSMVVVVHVVVAVRMVVVVRMVGIMVVVVAVIMSVVVAVIMSVVVTMIMIVVMHVPVRRLVTVHAIRGGRRLAGLQMGDPRPRVGGTTTRRTHQSTSISLIFSSSPATH